MHLAAPQLVQLLHGQLRHGVGGGTDGQGNQITFKKWGEQLHEAFDALETYDPDKARSILNELLQYQIDADITQNLQNIVANIDEVLKA